MPIFKKGSRARERERGAGINTSATGNRGGGGADGDVHDQQNAEEWIEQQRQQQQQQQSSRSSSGTRPTCSSLQPQLPPAVDLAAPMHVIDQRQLELPSSPFVQMDGDMANMVGGGGGGQVSYEQQQEQMSPRPYGHGHLISPGPLSQVAPPPPPLPADVSPIHRGRSGDTSVLPHQSMALQMPMQLPTHHQHQHQHQQMPQPYGPPLPRAADIAAVACAQQQQRQQQSQPPQPPSQDASPLHIAAGPALVPMGTTAASSSVPAAGQAVVPDDNNNNNVHDVQSSGVERDADITDSVAYGEEDDEEEDDDDEDEDEDDDLPLPTVTEAAEDVWHNDADDFVGVAESLRMLRQAILATVENDGGGDGHESGGGVEGRTVSSSGRRRDEFDPAETFLSIQGAALRYHARWESRVKDRLRARDEREQRRRVRKERRASKLRSVEANGKGEAVSDTSRLPARDISFVVENATDLIDKGKASTMTEIDTVVMEGEQGEKDARSIALAEAPTRIEESNSLANGEGNEEAIDDDDATVSTDGSSKSDTANWEEDEQAAWDVWEEAAAVAAALATVCVGPAFRSQIRRRRQWLVNGRTDLLVRHNSQMSDDGMSVSTVGMGSVAGAAWQAQAAQEHAQLGQAMRQTLGGTPELEEVTDTSMGSNPQAGGRLLSQGASGSAAASAGGGFEQWHHPIIPEVLPAAMLRFASSIGEMALPPLRTPDSAVQIKERSGRSTEST